MVSLVNEQHRPAYVPLRRRKESYEFELSCLGETYASARSGSPALQRVLDSLLWTPTWYVGNGGTMAVAQYAAELQNERTGQPAVATTSLGFATTRVAGRSAVIVISAGAKHPDTEATVRAALDRSLARVVLVTERERSELTGAFTASQLEVITLRRPGPRDGFLATNSVLNISTSFAAACTAEMPTTLPSLTERSNATIRLGDDVVILATGGTWAAATDLETRLIETGLATVQKTDFRNFAHGRHLGLSRMADHVSVIAMSDARTDTLAEATLALLPPGIPRLHFNSSAGHPVAHLDLMVRSMHLAGVVADGAGFDAARPEVPAFGRQLYRLDSRRHVATDEPAPGIVAKLEAAVVPVTQRTLDHFGQQRRNWLRVIRETPIASLLVDYDGTVCETAGRFDPPSEPVCTAFIRLLRHGVPVGFVSGRGTSLPEALRAWIPPELQNRVVVGLYNGAVVGPLDRPETLIGDGRGPFAPTGHARRLVREVERIAHRYDGSVTVRPLQVSVEPNLSGAILWPALTKAVEELISRHASGKTAVKVVRSAHSLDLVPATTSKNAVRGDLSALQRMQGRTLAVGDRGGLGGNDFELLAFDPFTLSVDQVSGDPRTCWNLTSDGRRGPDLLSRYLQVIRPDRRRVHTFRWSLD